MILDLGRSPHGEALADARASLPKAFDRNKKEPERYAVRIEVVLGTQKPKITAEGLREVGVETENQRDWADS
jgi:hypothetical protein